MKDTEIILTIAVPYSEKRSNLIAVAFHAQYTSISIKNVAFFVRITLVPAISRRNVSLYL
jgi:hypothetical protein